MASINRLVFSVLSFNLAFFGLSKWTPQKKKRLDNTCATTFWLHALIALATCLVINSFGQLFASVDAHKWLVLSSRPFYFATMELVSLTLVSTPEIVYCHEIYFATNESKNVHFGLWWQAKKTFLLSVEKKTTTSYTWNKQTPYD